jgi:hypothetical protein
MTLIDVRAVMLQHNLIHVLVDMLQGEKTLLKSTAIRTLEELAQYGTLFFQFSPPPSRQFTRFVDDIWGAIHSSNSISDSFFKIRDSGPNWLSRRVASAIQTLA